MKSRQNGHHGREDRHGMGLVWNTIEDVLYILMERRVFRERTRKFVALGLGWKFSVNQKIRRFDKSGMNSQFLDRNAAVAENPFFTINKAAAAEATSRICVPVIERNVRRLCSEFTNVDGLLTLYAIR